ncbi:MAG: 5-formyltetrahydrofolate cyclo-ligase [Clostridia bacterium]|nr:5-formyltetrahydrofolate cyclo-ligase [Clostridia bacterium]
MKCRRAENENRDLKEAALIEKFFSSSAGDKARYFVYLSFSGEAPTDKLIARLQESGKAVYCPRLEGGKMFAVPIGEDFSLSSLGIREPVGEVYAGGIDVVVLPLLAIDKKGNRLGYGGGYYDRFLAEHPEALPVAWCYDFQLTESVPSEPWDIPARLIITDKQIIRVSK